MLTYTTIFIASIILALIALVFYRVIVSSKSILSSKEPFSIISTPNPEKGKAPFTTTGTPAFAGQNSSVTPERMAKTHPAMPTEYVDWGWETGGNHVREHRPHHTTGGGNTEHCSLYNDADSVAPPNWSAGRLHREDKREAYGNTYKVTRKVDPLDLSPDDSGKPWGW
jgi:hypothetical protein